MSTITTSTFAPPHAGNIKLRGVQAAGSVKLDLRTDGDVRATPTGGQAPPSPPNSLPSTPVKTSIPASTNPGGELTPLPSPVEVFFGGVPDGFGRERRRSTWSNEKPHVVCPPDPAAEEASEIARLLDAVGDREQRKPGLSEYRRRLQKQIFWLPEKADLDLYWRMDLKRHLPEFTGGVSSHGRLGGSDVTGGAHGALGLELPPLVLVVPECGAGELFVDDGQAHLLASHAPFRRRPQGMLSRPSAGSLGCRPHQH